MWKLKLTSWWKFKLKKPNFSANALLFFCLCQYGIYSSFLLHKLWFLKIILRKQKAKLLPCVFYFRGYLSVGQDRHQLPLLPHSTPRSCQMKRKDLSSVKSTERDRFRAKILRLTAKSIMHKKWSGWLQLFLVLHKTTSTLNLNQEYNEYIKGTSRHI